MPWKSPKEKTPPAPLDERVDEELRSEGRAPLSEIAQKVKHIEISSRRNSRGSLAGQYKSRFRGQGVQFSEFRVYQFGDDVRLIDWRSSARSQETFIKTFEEDRELNIIFAVDTSCSLQFGSTGQSKFETLCVALATIGLSAAQNSDRVGLVLFSDKVDRYVPPNKGRKHILRLVDEILNAPAKPIRAQPTEALNMIQKLARSNSTVILASDMFLNFDKHALNRAAKKFDLILMRISDPKDAQLPAIGLVELEDPETGASVVIDTSSKRVQTLLQQKNEAFTEELRTLTGKLGASLLELATDQELSRALFKFFKTRRGR